MQKRPESVSRRPGSKNYCNDRDDQYRHDGNGAPGDVIKNVNRAGNKDQDYGNVHPRLHAGPRIWM